MDFYEGVKKEIQTLAPSSFAIVMSTGVISIASNLLGYPSIASFLFYLNNIIYAILLILLLLRIVLFFPLLAKDLASEAKGAGFLTVPTASCTLGLQYALMKENFSITPVLWTFALVFWLVFMYAFFILLLIKKEKPALEEGLNGSWLLLVVSTQSLSILASILAPHVSLPTNVILFTAFAVFLTGFMFYVIIITLTFHRLIFSPLKPAEFTPPDWIDMGAAAITALSAATLAKAIGDSVLFSQYQSFVKAIGMLSWAIATWWIPIVFILEIRRHLYQKNSFKYQSAYWSLVFPLGMYTVCSIRLSEALGFPYLFEIAQKFVFIAFAAWAITFIGMFFTIVRTGAKPGENTRA